jgi:hypothetical protein
MGKCMAIIETTRAKPKGGLRMTTRVEISNAVAVKSIFLTLLYTRISNRSMRVSLSLEPPPVSTCLEGAEEGQGRPREIKVRSMRKWT